MDSNLKSYQSLYASLTAEITANLSKISQNLKSATIPEDAIGKSLEFNKVKSIYIVVNFELDTSGVESLWDYCVAFLADHGSDH